MSPARTGDIELSVRTSVGVLSGTAKELVYDQAVSDNYKVSELVWPFKALALWGVGLDMRTGGGFFGSFGLKSGLSGMTGAMSDSDFLNGDGVRTHYSQSDCWTEQALLLDLEAGWSFPVAERLELGFYGSVEYMNFKWSARDGYLQYPVTGNDYSFGTGGNLIPGTHPAWKPGMTSIPIYGTGIIYQQSYFYPAIGVRASYRQSARLSLAASFCFSPSVICNDEDNHELRLLDFTETMSNGIMFEPRLDAAWSVSDRAAIELGISYRLITGLIGDSTMVSTGVNDPTNYLGSGPSYAGPNTKQTYTNGGGASYSALELILALRLAL
jgi:outer membrane protease